MYKQSDKTEYQKDTKTLDDNTKKNPILDTITREEMLIFQLKHSIDNENFEKSAKLRDYIESLNIDIKKYLK